MSKEVFPEKKDSVGNVRGGSLLLLSGHGITMTG